MERDSGLPRREPVSHRRPGKARIDVPPESFRQEAWANPREPLFIAVGGLLAVMWGGSTVLDGGPAWQRGLGVLAALAGVLVWVSYFLRFQPSLLAGQRWTRTRPRRALRAVVAHAWAVFLIAAVLAWLVSLVAG